MSHYMDEGWIKLIYRVYPNADIEQFDVQPGLWAKLIYAALTSELRMTGSRSRRAAFNILALLQRC
ncbi:MAG: hypothetical protein U0892_07640 [Pirellulales bacterium]